MIRTVLLIDYDAVAHSIPWRGMFVPFRQTDLLAVFERRIHNSVFVLLG